MAFTPFMQSTEAQSIIDNYLTNPTPNQNTGVFRNPQYDLRTDQGLPADAQFPNPQLDFSAEETPTDPCPEGYMLVDGVCQPIEQFGQSSYQENNNNDNEQEERKYMSIEDMKNASDEEFLDYLTSGFLGNSLLGYLPSKGTQVTLKGTPPNILSLGLGVLGLNDSALRERFIMDELTRRGYFTGQFDKNKNPIFDIGNKNVNTNVGGIESALPQNVQGQPVTDVYGDTYQQIANNQGNTGYTFTSGNPQDQVGQATQSGVIYGVGRGGGQSPSGTGTPVNYSQTGNPFLTQPPQMTAAQQQYMEDYDK
jgi:hypothetical protein